MRLGKTTKRLREAARQRHGGFNDAAKLKQFIIAVGYMPPLSMIFGMPDASVEFSFTIYGTGSGSGS